MEAGFLLYSNRKYPHPFFLVSAGSEGSRAPRFRENEMPRLSHSLRGGHHRLEALNHPKHRHASGS